MTPEQINLVQDSFDKVKPSAMGAIDLLYDRLFTIAPQVRPLFRGDASEQRRMLMTVLGTAVAGLGRLDKLRPTLGALGCRHATYGVEPAHYWLFGDALIWALEMRLGKSFTPAIKQAWVEAYAELANAMINAAGEATSAPAGHGDANLTED
ncbi:MAG: globin family protein [Geminicoccaceae bacterium]